MNPPTDVAFQATASSGVPAVADAPSLAGRDAVFAWLGGTSLPRPGETAIDLSTADAISSGLDRPALLADPAWARAGVPGGPKLLDLSTPLLPDNRQGPRVDPNAVSLMDGSSDGEESPAPSATDCVFAGLGKDALSDS
jgi:hypothetical protein